MLLPIPDVLSAEQVRSARHLLDQADWVDGRVTAGHQSSRTKDNMQLAEGSAAARELGAMILTALEQNALWPGQETLVQPFSRQLPDSHGRRPDWPR